LKKPPNSRLRKGDHVSFRGDPHIYIVEDPKPFQCDKPCDIPHESCCFDEPYVHVKTEAYTTMPLSQLETVFDKRTHVGRAFRQ